MYGDGADFEVVGDEDVMGDVMGIAAPYSRGYQGRYGGAYHQQGGHSVMNTRGGRMMAIGNRPGWRKQLAPGVIQPDEGLIPLPLVGTGGTNTFTSTLNSITFQGTIQKPFRGERVLVSTVRTGTTSTGRLLTQMFVGTDLMLADINTIDLELVGQATAFGTRLTMKAAEPGVLIRFIVTLSSALTTTDTILASMMLLGRVVH